MASKQNPSSSSFVGNDSGQNSDKQYSNLDMRQNAPQFNVVPVTSSTVAGPSRYNSSSRDVDSGNDRFLNQHGGFAFDSFNSTPNPLSNPLNDGRTAVETINQSVGIDVYIDAYNAAEDERLKNQPVHNSSTTPSSSLPNNQYQQNPFSIPRQLNVNERPVMQGFKASERLFHSFDDVPAESEDFNCNKWLEDNHATISGNNIPAPAITFESCNFGEQIESILLADYHSPLPLQSLVWPAFFDYRDVIVVGPPNSGSKVALSVSAVMTALYAQGTSVVIVTSRKDAVLAIQNYFNILNADKKLRIGIGYESKSKSKFLRNDEAKDGPHILIITLYALIKCINDRTINISNAKLMIFHNCNFMFSSGNYDEIAAIRAKIRPPFQTMFFMNSSTDAIVDSFRQHTNDPLFISVTAKQLDTVKDECAHQLCNLSLKLKNLAGYRLDDIYWELYNDACNKNLSLDMELLKQQKFVSILEALNINPKNIEEYGQKLLVLNNILFVHELLQCSILVSDKVTIAPEDETSKNLREYYNSGERQNEVLTSTVRGDVCENVMVIRGNFFDDKNLEKILLPKRKLYLVPIEKKQSTANIDAITVSFLLILRDGPCTLLLVNVSSKKFETLRPIMHELFSVHILPYPDTFNAVRISINNVLEGNSNVVRMVCPYVREATPLEINQDMALQNTRLTLKQREAVTVITNDDVSTFGLLGPPGSGKTSTLVEAIIQILQENESEKILVATPSNDAADVFVKALLAYIDDQRKILRFTASGRDAYKEDPEIAGTTQKVNLLAPRNYSNIRTVYASKTLEKIQTFSVIVTTLGSISKLKEFIKKENYFGYLFVDEVTQTNEMFIWELANSFGYYNNRLIIAGDPMQLGPVTTCLLLNNPEFGFKRSLLSRLCNDPYFVANPKFFIHLDVNHRSHPAIAHIASLLFYNNKMIPSFDSSTYKLCHVSFLPKKGFPIVFYDVCHGKECFTDSSSYNLEEVKTVSALIQECKLNNVSSEDIGIVSPYNAQSEKIREAIKDDAIIVDSVEKYQGGEKSVIILTSARTTTLGFIEERERFNTAITRAKHLLLVVGNQSALQHCSFWNEFIKYCKENESVITISK